MMISRYFCMFLTVDERISGAVVKLSSDVP